MGITELRATLRADYAKNDEWLDRVSLTVFRFGQYALHAAFPVKVMARLADIVFLRLLIGAEMPAQVGCGPGLRLPHAGRGIVLHPNTVLGSNVTLYHRVTIGVRGTAADAPVIGDGVYIGNSASILGAIHIGDGARIGAGAVVVHDVPPGTTAIGIPARAPAHE